MVVILLMTIYGYFINGDFLIFYKWLLVVILLMILMATLLMVIDGYFIGGYWCLLIAII